MTPAHVHPGPADAPAALAGPAAAAAALLLAAAYLMTAARLRRRGDAWPPYRDVSFTAGCAALAWAAAGRSPGGPFTAHMAQHLVVGMAAPLLLVLARPLTLLLRGTPPGPVRRALRALLGSRPAGWLAVPPVAALLDVGGLWLLYRTGLFAATGQSGVARAVVHTHVLLAGTLFTLAVCQTEPVRRRWGLALRGGALLVAGAAHATLAKSLYASPPPGTSFDPADLHTGARLMYYGGDLVEVALAVVVAGQWFTRPVRAGRRRAPTPAAGRRRSRTR
ncbi:cytochrome c oxidase assembly protein [Streptomyces lavendulocolor]|uniref:cytochrome c oxidase assembly protein n=1 Tax=Streptomyces lavendulocolor TaxID=67316 RepID=UPI0033EAB4D8